MSAKFARITRRKDQVTFRKGMPAGETIIGGLMFCTSKESQWVWVGRLIKAGLANYFVLFNDRQSPWAIQFGWADWVQPGGFHVIP